MTMASKSYKKPPAHKDSYDALIKSLFMDEDDMDKAVAAMGQSAQFKRKHDDQEEYHTAGSDEGKDKKRSRKDTQPSKKSSASKESSKGNTPPKSSKSGKSVTTEEPDEEHMHDMLIDAKENIVDEMGNVDEHPYGDAALKNDWFKQPPRPLTLDPKWNKCQVVDDQPEQIWFDDLVSSQKVPLTIDELMAIPIDFYKFAKNRLKLDKITKVDLENHEGDRCPFDLNKPLPLKGRPDHLTATPRYFFNNDLEYLKSTDSERKYTTSITKTKAARSQLNRFSKHDVYSPLKILSVLYKFKEGDFVNLHLNDIKDMLLLVVQHKLFHLDGEVNVDLAMALRVESYKKKLNVTKPQKDFPVISANELYTPSFEPPRVFYEDLSHQKRLMRADELYKFSDGTVKKVRDTLHHMLLNF
ncbi:hypothetical protein Tco_0845197 [Tanacetum coccineum]